MVSLSELKDIISLKIIEILGVLNKKHPDVRIDDLKSEDIFSGRINISDVESVQFIYKQHGDLNLSMFWFSDTSNIINETSSWFCVVNLIHIDDENECYCETSNVSFCRLTSEKKSYFIEPSDYELADLWRSFELIKLITPYWIKNEPTQRDLEIFKEFASKISLESSEEK